MQLSKRPIVMYDGILKQLQGNDNVGKYVMTVTSKSVGNNNDELFSFMQVHADSSAGSFTLKMPQSPELGDFVKVVDVKSVFSVNKITIDPNGKKIEGATGSIDLDVSGAIVDFIYAGEDDGWLLDIGGKNLNIFDDSIQFSIAPSDGTVGDRTGRVVFQTAVANTVDLADAGAATKVPAFGVVVHDADTYVKVRSKVGVVVDAKFDTLSTTPTPGDHMFLSKQELGKVTNNQDFDDAEAVQRLGSCNTGPSEGYIKLNLWPNPEIYM